MKAPITSCVPVYLLLRVVLLGAMLLSPRLAFATPTEQEILRSFNENMDQAPDYGRLIPWAFAVAGAVAIVIYFRQWQKRQAIPRTLNHPKKLVKEIAKSINIDPAEMKRLTHLSQELNCDNPLTLMICPSLMNQATPPETPADA